MNRSFLIMDFSFLPPSTATLNTCHLESQQRCHLTQLHPPLLFTLPFTKSPRTHSGIWQAHTVSPMCFVALRIVFLIIFISCLIVPANIQQCFSEKLPPESPAVLRCFTANIPEWCCSVLAKSDKSHRTILGLASLLAAFHTLFSHWQQAAYYLI